jgi:hypothetical protein
MVCFGTCGGDGLHRPTRDGQTTLSLLTNFREEDADAPSGDQPWTYHLADEIAGMWRGMTVVPPERFWQEKFAPLTPVELARCLTELAARADLSKYRKRPPSPKRAERQRPCQPGSHISTARMLEEVNRKLKC